MQIASRATGGIVRLNLASGGQGYTAAPTVSISGSGTGATAVAIMDGTAVKSVQVVSPGSGYTAATVSFTGGGGTGAAATANVYTGQLVPMTFLKGRYNDVYGVDGMGRGIRWDGAASSATPIGLLPPAKGPTITASTTANYYVSGIQVVFPGAGFNQNPTVTLSGGSYTKAAVAQASIANGRLAGIKVIDPGAGYQTAPTVTISGGQGSGASFSVGIEGSVHEVYISDRGSGFTAGDILEVVFSTAQGLTEAEATVTVDEEGSLGYVNILSPGRGATTEGVTATVPGGGVLDVRMKYRVKSVTASSSGQGYMSQPFVTFRAASGDHLGAGAAATAYVNTTGNITGVSVFQGGEYFARPEALIYETPARATATIAANFRGVYQCAIRYLDGTDPSQDGPVPSSISELVEVDSGDASAELKWNFNHSQIDSRVTAMELWRTTAGQSVVLFRVATIQRADFSNTYTDTIQDPDLIDPTRSGYGMMPVTLPSGQLNARRFDVPPGNYAVACMFQDRAWYAVDTTGEKPNSLLYSEINEPESVPLVNELVLQENTAQPDKIVALIPLSTTLVVAQQNHIYKLSYVAQPVIDASVLLGAYRGILNSRCFSTLNGVAFIADSVGMYAYDGSKEEPISVPVDNYWRDGIIDFTKSSKFHVSSDHARKIVRFHYCKSGDTEPVRALCFCVATQAWWEETYPVAVTASVPVAIDSRRVDLFGTAGGYFTKPTSLVDVSATPVPYEIRTGNLPLLEGAQSRAVEILYNPTNNDATLTANLHFNNSQTARANAIRVDRGEGFVADTSGAGINLKRARSALGDSTGAAKMRFSGHRDQYSSGADRHVAIDLSGQQALDAVTLYDLNVEGVPGE
jgi:hypothetical protein